MADMVDQARPRDENGRFMKSEQMVVLPPDDFQQMQQEMAELRTSNYKMSEDLVGVGRMIDERGWSPIYDYGSDGGLSLSQLRASSEQLRELVVGNPFVGRGAAVRSIYVWGAGVEFGAKNPVGSKAKTTPSLKTEVQKLVDDVRNQRYIFGADAQLELERAAYTDGMVFALGDIAKKTFERVSLKQITADLRNPDNPEEVWAYRRVWTRDPNMPNPVQIVRWYYTDIYDGTRHANIKHGDKLEQVDRTKTIIDKKFNGQIGWALGVPDALAIIAWARLYREFLVNGYIMSKALAQLAYKATQATATGANTAAVQVAQRQQAGSTAVVGAGGNFEALPSAGKGYDFVSGHPLLAAMAAGVGVSEDALSAKGGSDLDSPSRASAAMRRRSWEEFFVRIFRFMGNTKKLRVIWHDLPDEQIQRRLQAWTLLHNSGLFAGQIVRDGLADAMQITEPGDIPDGYMLPNNEKSLNRADVDADGNPVDPGATGAGGATAGTGQGQGGDGDTGGKGSGLGNDHSTD